MSTPLPFILQPNNVTVFIAGRPYPIGTAHLSYKQIVDAIRDKQWDVVRDLVNPRVAIAKYTQGNVVVTEDDEILMNGKPVHKVIATRTIEMMRAGFPFEHMLMFLNNANANPLPYVATDLFNFLEANNHPITDDGCFIAYKKVRRDYKDVHTGTMDNSVGKTVVIDRATCDTDRNNTCSRGLHFCSFEYLKQFGGDRVVVVKINPKDVTAFPPDYGNSKGRCCSYEVIGELDAGPETKNVLATSSVVAGDFSDFDQATGYEEDEDGEDEITDIDAVLEGITLTEKRTLYNVLAKRHDKPEFTAQRFRDHDGANEKLLAAFSADQILAQVAGE